MTTWSVFARLTALSFMFCVPGCATTQHISARIDGRTISAGADDQWYLAIVALEDVECPSQTESSSKVSHAPEGYYGLALRSNSPGFRLLATDGTTRIEIEVRSELGEVVFTGSSQGHSDVTWDDLGAEGLQRRLDVGALQLEADRTYVVIVRVRADSRHGTVKITPWLGTIRKWTFNL